MKVADELEKIKVYNEILEKKIKNLKKELYKSVIKRMRVDG